MKTFLRAWLLCCLFGSLPVFADDSADCCPPGSAAVVCTCLPNPGRPVGDPPPSSSHTPPSDPKNSCGGTWTYEVNPQSTDQFACKENGKIVAKFRSCNDDGSCENHDLIVANCRARCEKGEFGDVNPGPSTPPEPVSAKLLVNVSFTNIKTCETKMEAVNAAADSIAASGAQDKIPNPDAYCKALYPLGDKQTLDLNAALSANYTFQDADDCVTKVSATEEQAISVKRVSAANALEDVGDAQNYCTGLFPTNPPSKDPPPAPKHAGSCGAWMNNYIGHRACGHPLKVSNSIHSDNQDMCSEFCSQFGTGYCGYLPGDNNNCSWIPADSSDCGPIFVFQPFLGISASLCGDAPMPPTAP